MRRALHSGSHNRLGAVLPTALLANSTIRIASYAAQDDQHDESDLARMLLSMPRSTQADDRGEQAHRTIRIRASGIHHAFSYWEASSRNTTPQPRLKGRPAAVCRDLSHAVELGSIRSRSFRGQASRARSFPSPSWQWHGRGEDGTVPPDLRSRKQMFGGTRYGTVISRKLATSHERAHVAGRPRAGAQILHVANRQPERVIGRAVTRE